MNLQHKILRSKNQITLVSGILIIIGFITVSHAHFAGDEKKSCATLSYFIQL